MAHPHKERTMTINHIDQLNEWYESAERITKTNLPNDGDVIIYPRFGGGGYVIETDTKDWEAAHVQNDEECRIFHRAPAPKPAWHDAVAVIARTGEHSSRELFVNHDDDCWLPSHGSGVGASDLRDVTPLIEAKVTDGMRKRVGDVLMSRYGTTGPDGTVDAILTAALGLDPA